MKVVFSEQTQTEKFAKKLYNLLVENFPQTYFVGGTVRDILLNKNVTDIDIATKASPNQVMAFLHNNGYLCNDVAIKFGVVVAQKGRFKAEITTFRKELYGNNRYPIVSFVNSINIDAKRRDFTINALYLQAKTNKIFDFYSGLKDIKKQQIKFIGDPKKRIAEDPLRIIRALRFVVQNNFTLDKKNEIAIKKYFYLLKNISKNKIQTEINKMNVKDKKIFYDKLKILDTQNIFSI